MPERRRKSTYEIDLAKLAVSEACEELHSVTAAFARIFAQADRWPAALDPDLQVENPRRAALELWTDYYFSRDGGDPRDTRRALGLIAVPSTVALAARSLNAAKTRFRAACVALRKAVGEMVTVRYVQEGLPAYRRPAEISRALNRLRAGRIHLLQAYRKIVILSEDVERVSFSKTRSVVRERLATPEFAAELERHRGEGELNRAIYRLPDHVEAVRVRMSTWHWRANAKRGGRWTQTKAHMPIMVVREDPGDPLPAHNLDALDRPERTRQTRRDRRTDPRPVVPGVYLVRS